MHQLADRLLHSKYRRARPRGGAERKRLSGRLGRRLLKMMVRKNRRRPSNLERHVFFQGAEHFGKAAQTKGSLSRQETLDLGSVDAHSFCDIVQRDAGTELRIRHGSREFATHTADQTTDEPAPHPNVKVK
jgi:hypothetical protein